MTVIRIKKSGSHYEVSVKRPLPQGAKETVRWLAKSRDEAVASLERFLRISRHNTAQNLLR